MKLSDIKPNPRNPRTITEDKLDKLKKSIEEMPKGLSIKPMIVDENNVIIGGNQRYLALVELGYDEISEDFDLDDLDSWGLDVVSFSPEVDYSVLDYVDIEDEVEDMKKSVKRGIMLDFDSSYYNEAHELFKYYRSKKIDVGKIILTFLKQEKEKYT